MSFAFFESVVFPLVDRRKLKRCVLLCDKHGFQRATAEAFALRQATREYIAATVPCKGSFHPKVWLMLNEQKLALLVGSGNLTQSGFIDNLELFETLELESGGSGKSIADDVYRFLDGLIGMWPITESGLLAVEAITELRSAVQSFSQTLTEGNVEARFVTSFDGDFDQVLADAVTELDELHIASPYFGGSLAGIERMQAALNPGETWVYPAIHSGEMVDLPLDAARDRDGISLGVMKSLVAKNRFSHLKLFGAVKGDQRWLMNGSVNCTDAAIAGNNVEAAVLRPVSTETFAQYFSPESTKELVAKGQLQTDYESSNWWLFWATDLGDRIELVTDKAGKLPLSNVTLELRAGGHRASFGAEQLFVDGGSATFPWSCFGETKANAGAARLIQIAANDSVGNRVTGAALVDDVAALSAAPSHRGAWRAAVALLSSEGMPHYADIAALFSLVQDVAFDDEDDDDQSVRKASGSTDTNKQAKAAKWPPEPIDSQSHFFAGARSAGGQLHWFDRILASLLRRADDPDTDAAATSSDADDEGASIIEANADPKVVVGCGKVWDHAFKQFCKLENELSWMEIDLKRASRLWGPVTFMFLGTLAVRHSIIKAVGDSVKTFPMTELLRDSVQMMLCERDQGDDFSPPKSCCYDDALFPSVARDLMDRFGVYPHPEVCVPWLLTLAHLYASEQKAKQNEFVLTAWLNFKDVAGDHLSVCLNDFEHVKRLWQRYFGAGIEGLTWLEIESAITSLVKLSWYDHIGFAEVWSQRESVAAGRFEVCDDTSGACLSSNCRLSGNVDPVNGRLHRELRITKCTACGTLMIPTRLHEILKQELAIESESFNGPVS